MSVPPQKPYRFSCRELAVCLVLLAGIALIYSSLFHAGFINLDDYEYVKYNVHVHEGFTSDNVKWAFTPGYASNWHPLTWFSHMLDYKLFGLDAGWHHLMNVAIHGLNAVVLFLFLRWLTNRFWECAFVAALFAVHPLHVESVAWIAERKDVLSTFLILLCLWAYAGYARARSSGAAHSKRYYVASIVLSALALMAKPMAVTVPFVLLLLDFWPLNRFSPRLWRVLIWEKLPFIVMTAATCVLTLKAQTHAMSPWDKLPLGDRLINALSAYAAYLRKLLWPTDLSIMYPLAPIPWQTVVVASIVLVAISVFAIRAVRARPYLMFGWLWFLGMLVPTIGLVQVGSQRFADRYTYLPLVGICIAIIWWAADVITRENLRRCACVAGAVVVVSFGACAKYETGYWHDSIRLFTHGLKHTTNNFFLVSGMASVLDESDIPGISKESAFYYHWAFLLNADDAALNYNYGNFWAKRGVYESAISYYDKAIAARKNYESAFFDKANTLALMGRFAEAETNFIKTLAINPANVNAEVNYAGNFAVQREFEKAMPHYKRALQLAPHYAKAHHLMGVTLARMGRMEDAVAQFRLAVHDFDQPDMTVWNDLAWMLAIMQQPSIHNPAEAVRLAKIACQLCDYDDVAPLDTLAVAYAEAGQFDDAVRIADKTIAIGKTKNRPDFLAEMERRRQLYLKHQPYRPQVISEERPVKSMLDLSPHN